MPKCDSVANPMKYLEEETRAAKELTDKRWAGRLVPDITDGDIVSMLEASQNKSETAASSG